VYLELQRTGRRGMLVSINLIRDPGCILKIQQQRLLNVSSNYGPLAPEMKKARKEGFINVLWTTDDYMKELT
jgi:hypothetical protein